MGYFQVRYDSRVVIYERKMFIRLATGKLTLELGRTTKTKDFYLYGLCSLPSWPIRFLTSFYLSARMGGSIKISADANQIGQKGVLQHCSLNSTPP